MGDPGDAAGKRARWQQYFEQRLTGSEAEVRTATDAAIEAGRQGKDVDGIIAAGLAAAKHYRDHGTAPQAAPSPPAPPPAPPRSAPAQPQPQSRGSGAIGSATSGMVNGFQQRQEMLGRTYFTVWNFRLERRDASGQPLPPIPVEMKGRFFKGAINNGDIVDIGQSYRQGELVTTQRVRNVTVGVDVVAVGRQHRVLRNIGITIFAIIAICIFGLILTQMWNIATFELPDPGDLNPEFPEP